MAESNIDMQSLLHIYMPIDLILCDLDGGRRRLRSIHLKVLNEISSLTWSIIISLQHERQGDKIQDVLRQLIDSSSNLPATAQRAFAALCVLCALYSCSCPHDTCACMIKRCLGATTLAGRICIRRLVMMGKKIHGLRSRTQGIQGAAAPIRQHQSDIPIGGLCCRRAAETWRDVAPEGQLVMDAESRSVDHVDRHEKEAHTYDHEVFGGRIIRRRVLVVGDDVATFLRSNLLVPTRRQTSSAFSSLGHTYLSEAGADCEMSTSVAVSAHGGESGLDEKINAAMGPAEEGHGCSQQEDGVELKVAVWEESIRNTGFVFHQPLHANSRSCMVDEFERASFLMNLFDVHSHMRAQLKIDHPGPRSRSKKWWDEEGVHLCVLVISARRSGKHDDFHSVRLPRFLRQYYALEEIPGRSEYRKLATCSPPPILIVAQSTSSTTEQRGFVEATRDCVAAFLESTACMNIGTSAVVVEWPIDIESEAEDSKAVCYYVRGNLIPACVIVRSCLSCNKMIWIQEKMSRVIEQHWESNGLQAISSSCTDEGTSSGSNDSSYNVSDMIHDCRHQGNIYGDINEDRILVLCKAHRNAEGGVNKVEVLFRNSAEMSRCIGVGVEGGIAHDQRRGGSRTIRVQRAAAEWTSWYNNPQVLAKLIEKGFRLLEVVFAKTSCHEYYSSPHAGSASCPSQVYGVGFESGARYCLVGARVAGARIPFNAKEDGTRRDETAGNNLMSTMNNEKEWEEKLEKRGLTEGGGARDEGGRGEEGAAAAGGASDGICGKAAEEEREDKESEDSSSGVGGGDVIAWLIIRTVEVDLPLIEELSEDDKKLLEQLQLARDEYPYITPTFTFEFKLRTPEYPHSSSQLPDATIKRISIRTTVQFAFPLSTSERGWRHDDLYIRIGSSDLKAALLVAAESKLLDEPRSIVVDCSRMNQRSTQNSASGEVEGRAKAGFWGLLTAGLKAVGSLSRSIEDTSGGSTHTKGAREIKTICDGFEPTNHSGPNFAAYSLNDVDVQHKMGTPQIGASSSIHPTLQSVFKPNGHREDTPYQFRASRKWTNDSVVAAPANGGGRSQAFETTFYVNHGFTHMARTCRVIEKEINN